MIISRIEEQRLDPCAELAGLMRSAAGDGAIVSFVGLARGTTKQGEPLNMLVLQHHPILTQKSVDDIAAEGARRFDLTNVLVVHRCGDIMPGEPIVFVGTSSKHRRAAFEAAEYLMDRLKTEAFFWKREDGPGGSNWIEPTDVDYADRARWE